MIVFRFTINDSFNTYSTSPITVPKSLVDYSELTKQGLDRGEFIIIFPKGEKIRGHMYSGEAGFGHYYQIRVHSNEVVPQYLIEGEEILVLIFSDARNKYVTMEYRE